MMMDTLRKALVAAALVAGVAAAHAQAPAKGKTASKKVITKKMTVKKDGDNCAVPAKGVKTVACAVMPGDKVDPAQAVKAGNYADYKGKRYVFCCPNCISAFKKEPAKYAAKATPIGNTPKSGKKA